MQVPVFDRPSFLFVVCLLVVGAVGVRTQNPPPAPQQPTFRAGVNTVRVDVIVTDRQGSPVATLTADDFELTEDGKPRRIDNCRLIHVQARVEAGGEAPRAIHSFDDEATELAREDLRIIVIFLDDYHTSRISAFNLRSWLRHFIDAQVGPYDVIAPMYPLTPTSGLTFTRDKFALGSIIERFEGRRGDYTPRNEIEANYAMEMPWRIEEIRSQVVVTALRSLCVHLGAVSEARKSVIVVADALNMRTSDLRDISDAANRSNVAIYPLDSGGVGAFGASDMLRSLADNTNGRAIVGRNDLDAGLETMLRDSSAYYLLGYNSDKGADGKFHQIGVRVKKAGLEVRARKGYWAPTAEEAASALQPARPSAPGVVTAALAAIAEPRDRVVRTWVGMSRGDKGRTRVTFVWEPGPLAARSPDDRPAHVLLTATGPNGTKYFDGEVGGAATGSGTATPAPARVSFDAPPGRLEMAVEVRSARSASSGDVLDRDAREIAVPDFSNPGALLSSPVLYAARTAREYRALMSDPDALPASHRQFSRNDRLLVRFETYGVAASNLSARLLNRHGDPMIALDVQSGPAPDKPSIDLPLSTLPPGEYVIEISAKGTAGEAKALLAFRVTG